MDDNIIIPHDAKILDIILHECKMARFQNQEAAAIEMITEFVNELYENNDQILETNIVPFLLRRIVEIDELLSAQINEILHHPDFQKLEGSWRGFYYFIMNIYISMNL